MPDELFSESWYRVRDLKPRIRRHISFYRHDYRGQIWYVLRDPAAERSFRFTPAANYVFGLLDGERSVDAVWRQAGEHLGEDAPGQDELIRILSQLHAADALQADLTPNVVEVFERHERQRSARTKQRLLQPLAIRIPLIDPDRFLDRTVGFVRPLFGGLGFLLWAAVVASGAVLAALNWEPLSTNLIDRVTSLDSIAFLVLAYVGVKAVHELGHGYAAKVRGGEVHELGVMLLVLMPVPYVDASSATAFRSKKHRMLVGAIGIMVELFLASIAIWVWLSVQPGPLRTLAFNVALIGSVSTLLFNGNPLLRFDGYYVLADALEIPNLAQRSKRYLAYLSERYLFGHAAARSPVTARGERSWFVIYGVASFVYRLFILSVIVLFVAGKFFVFGVILAAWAIATQILRPVGKGIWFVLAGPELRRTRARSVAVSGLASGALVALIGFVPMPLATYAEGVVWVPEESQVRMETEGFVSTRLVTDGAAVRYAQPILQAEDKAQRMRAVYLDAQLRQLQAQLAQSEFLNRAGAQVLRQDISGKQAELDEVRERVEALTLRSPRAGTFVSNVSEDVSDRFLRRGELIGYVMSPGIVTVKVAVSQDQIGLLRRGFERVDVLLSDWQAQPLAAEVIRATPAATDTLPTRVLSTHGGGRIVVNPLDEKPFENVFEFELAVPDLKHLGRIGNRVYARFDHGREPLASQWYRELRQLFLSRYGV